MEKRQHNMLSILSLLVLIFGLLGLTDNMRERTTSYILILVAAAFIFGYTLAKPMPHKPIKLKKRATKK